MRKLPVVMAGLAVGAGLLSSPARLAQAAAGKVLWTREADVNAAAFSPDGRTLAVSASEPECYLNNPNGCTVMELLDARTGQTLKTFRGKFKPFIHRIMFTPDGEYVAGEYSGMSRNVYLWRVSDAAFMDEIHLGSQSRYIDSDFSADGGYFSGLTGYSPHNNIQGMTWEIGDGQFRLLDPITLPDQPVVRYDYFAHMVAPGREVLVTESNRIQVRRWADRAVIREIPRVGIGMDYRFSRDGKILATFEDGGATIYDLKEGEFLSRIRPDSDIWNAVLSPGGEVLATLTKDNYMTALQFWSASDGRHLYREELPVPFGALHSVTFSPDGQFYTFSTPRIDQVEDRFVMARNPYAPRMRGDVNSDGFVNVVDAVRALQFVVQLEDPTPEEHQAGDLNEDARLTVHDAVLILKIAIHLPEG